MGLFVAAVFAVLIGYASATAKCPVPSSVTCNNALLSCCDQVFTSALKLHNCTGSFTDNVSCYRDQIEGLYAQGADGALTVCAAHSLYSQCLGIAQQSCESIQWNVQNGMDLGYARYQLTVTNQMKFMCGSGLNTFVNDDSCMMSVFANYKDTFKQCREQFSNNLRGNWMHRCTSFRELLGCTQAPFEKVCGFEPGWWGCEYQRSGVTVWLPDCAEQCTATNLNIRAPAPEQ